MNTTVDKIKCGQIFILSNDIFSLICEFCGKDYRNLEDFVVHITNHFPEPPTIIKQEVPIKQEDITREEIITEQQDIVNQPDIIIKQEESVPEDSVNEEASVKQQGVVVSDSEDESVLPETTKEKVKENLQEDGSVVTESSQEEWELLSVEDNQSNDDTMQVVEEIPTIRTRGTTNARGIDNTPGDMVKPVTSNAQRPTQLREETVIDLTEETQTNDENTRKTVSNPIYQCKICDLTIYSKFAFQDHINLHTGKQPHQCKICPSNFAQATTLERHIKQKHKHRHKCSVCGRTFGKKCKLDYHFRERHLPDNDPRRFFPCKLCDMKFDRQHKLHTHGSRMHSQKSVVTCDYCKRQFNSLSIIELHMQIHSSSKDNYNCTHCGNKFTHLGPKLRHEQNCKVVNLS